MSGNGDAENFPTVRRQGRNKKGAVIQLSPVSDASSSIHERTGSMGEEQSSYATLCPQLHSPATPYQDSTSNDFSKRTPRAADLFFSIANLMPKVWFGLSSEDLAKPLHGTGAAALDSKKSKLLSHTED